MTHGLILYGKLELWVLFHVFLILMLAIANNDMLFPQKKNFKLVNKRSFSGLSQQAHKEDSALNQSKFNAN